jgi:histidine triad (HIT) family protein
MNADPECIFCRIANGEIPSAMVYEDDLVIAFRDIHPAAPVHVLVVPRRHVASLNSLTDDDAALAAGLLRAAREVAKREAVADAGYRVVTNIGANGGQSVDHLHFHVLGGRPLRALG